MLKPTSHMTIDSSKVDPRRMKVLEEILYGTDKFDAQLPYPGEILELFSNDPALGIHEVPEYPGIWNIHYSTGTDLIGFKDEGIYAIHENSNLTEQGVGLYGL